MEMGQPATLVSKHAPVMVAAYYLMASQTPHVASMLGLMDL